MVSVIISFYVWAVICIIEKICCDLFEINRVEFVIYTLMFCYFFKVDTLVPW